MYLKDDLIMIYIYCIEENRLNSSTQNTSLDFKKDVNNENLSSLDELQLVYFNDDLQEGDKNKRGNNCLVLIN